MPAKKKLTKKKPAAKAAQPSSKKRPMSTKATPAAKKAAPKAKAKPMAKKKKPAAKKPARRPFHEGGMIDAELEMLERMAMDAVQSARDSATINDPEKMDRIFANLAMGIDQVREANRSGMTPKQPARPNPNVPQPQITPEQEQAVRAMNQARFSGPQFPRRTTNPEPTTTPRPRDPQTGLPIIEDRVPQPTRTNPIFITPEEQARRDRVNDYNQSSEQAREAQALKDKVNDYNQSSEQARRDALRVPFNQPPMDRRPQPTRPTVSPQQQQAMRAMSQARFTRPQVTPQMQAAARQRQQGTNAGTTPRPMNRGGMVLRPEQYQKAAARAKAMTPKKKFT